MRLRRYGMAESKRAVRRVLAKRVTIKQIVVTLTALILIIAIIWKIGGVWEKLVVPAGETPSPSASASVKTKPSGAVAPEPSPASAAGSPSPASPSAGAWATTMYRKQFAGVYPPTPKLLAIRTGAHSGDGYDRIAFDFRQSSAPGYTLRYVEDISRDASGEPIVMPGAAYLQITFSPADAHDDSGNSTVKNPPVKPVTLDYGALWAYVMNGDYEGHVSFALGLASKSGYRVGEIAQDGYWTVYVDVKRP